MPSSTVFLIVCQTPLSPDYVQHYGDLALNDGSDQVLLEAFEISECWLGQPTPSFGFCNAHICFLLGILRISLLSESLICM